MMFYSQMKSVRLSMTKCNSGKIGWMKRDCGSILQRLNIWNAAYKPQVPLVDGQDLKKVKCFKYRGSTLSADGDSLPDTRVRVSVTWLKWCQISGVLCDRRLPIHLKAKIYKTVVRPVALYGAECWPASTKHQQALHSMEMRMLRWALWLTRLDRVRNEDVRKILGVAPISEKMREARLRCYGHVIRSGEESVAGQALHLSPDGRRPPKKRWMDRIKQDMKQINAAPEDALNWKKWRAMCQTADPAPVRDKR